MFAVLGAVVGCAPPEEVPDVDGDDDTYWSDGDDTTPEPPSVGVPAADRADVRLVAPSFVSRGGIQVSMLRDVTQDDVPDVIVTAETPGYLESGRLAVLPGPLALGVVDVDAAPLQVVGGEAVTTLGSALADAGDVTGDGIGDVLAAGATWEEGADLPSAALFVIPGGLGGGTYDVQAIATVVRGEEGQGFTNRLRRVGDVGGDGVADLAVSGTVSPDDAYRSVTYVVHGPLAAGELDATLAGSRIVEMSAVSSNVDLDGDGCSDLLGTDEHSNSGDFQYYAFLCPIPAGTVDWSAADAGWVHAPLDDIGMVFRGVDSIGDVDGDGHADLAMYLSTSSGHTEMWVELNYGPIPEGTHSVGDADTRLTLAGSEQISALSVVQAGDFNGDGFGDFAVAVPDYAEGAHVRGYGGVFLFLGPIPTGHHEFADLAVDHGWYGPLEGELGQSLSGGHDLNQDGYDDLVAGVFANMPDTLADMEAWVFFGGPI